MLRKMEPIVKKKEWNTGATWQWLPVERESGYVKALLSKA
jgi:hypothetical protein